MRNFARAIQLALRYKWILVAAMGCSLAVAVLWGGNIGAVYPFMQVVLKGHSLRDWIDEEIETSNDQIANIEAELARLVERRDAASTDAEVDRLGQDIHVNEGQLETERQSLARSVWLQPYIHAYLPPGPFQTLIFVVVALVIGTIVKDIFLMGSMILVERAAQLTVFDLRKEFFRRTLAMDVGSFGEDRTSNLISRFTHDMQGVAGGLTSLFGAAIREPLKMFVCLTGAALICWRLLILSLVVAPVGMLLVNYLAKSIKRANRRAMEEMSQIYQHLTETFVGIQVVKAFNMERQERAEFHKTGKEYVSKSMRIAFYNSLTKPATEVMGIGIIAVAMLSGAYLVLRNETQLLGIPMCPEPPSVPAMMLFYGFLVGAADPLRKMTAVFNLIQRGAAAADRVYELMDREPKVLDPENPKPLPTPCGDIDFYGVEFEYIEGQPVLQNVGLTVRAGETVAIVGPNGCGKTTLANMVLRFYDPTSGSVRIGDVDLRDVRISDLRRRIGLVTQQAQLFDDSARDNIRYGSPHATDEEVEQAARKAYAHQFITEKLDNGYDTIVGESGCRLSGGQRQRLALARAILRDPEILILDEATSQVDMESEHLIHRALERFTRNRTAIMITHRLSTLELADRVVVMEAGRILDVGTHDELIGRCQIYQRLYEGRFRKSA